MSNRGRRARKTERIWPADFDLAADPSFHQLPFAIQICLLIQWKEGDRRSINGQIACPNRCGGMIRYNIAYNGHIHAGCTKGCVSFMQ